MRVENVGVVFPFGPFPSTDEAKAAGDSDAILIANSTLAEFLIFGDVPEFPVNGLLAKRVTNIDICYFDDSSTVLSIGNEHYLLVRVETNYIEADGVIHDSSDVNEALERLSDAMLGPDNDDDRSVKVSSIINNIVENVTTEGRELIAAIAAYEQESEYPEEAKKVCEIMLAPKVELQQKLPLEEAPST